MKSNLSSRQLDSSAAAPPTVQVLPRIDAIDSLRGLAALAVAWFHFTTSPTLPAWLRLTGTHGWLGVEAFFVISGFIIPFALFHSRYRFPGDAGRFLLKRIVRLDPPYFAAIAVTVVLSFLSAAAPDFQGDAPRVNWPALFAHVGYLNGLLDLPWVVPVFWTLAIEFQFYLAMALLFPLVAHPRPRIAIGTVAALAIVSLLVRSEALLPHYLGLFSLGILTFQTHSGAISRRLYFLLLLGATALTTVGLGVPAAIVGALTALAILWARSPRTRVLAFLGTISYSLYLLHIPIGGRVVNLGQRLATTGLEHLAVCLSALLVSLCAAWVFYRWVEQPSRRLASSIGFGSYTRKETHPIRDGS